MQNVQNAAEIQQRVINLVELYRTKVGKESNKAKDLAAEYKMQYDNEIDISMYLHEQGTNHYTLNIDFSEEEIDSLRVNQQLLGHFYKMHAGKDANPQVLTELLDKNYDNNIFTAEEESFLLKYFKEMVNYIIQTPNNDLSAIEVIERMDFYLMPSEVLELIKSRIDIPTGCKIYNPFTGFAQLACLYPDCSFFCEESYIPYNKRWNTYCEKSRKEANVIHHKIDENKLYAWMKVALYANAVDVTEYTENLPEEYDIAMAFVPWIPNAIPEDAYGYTGKAKNDQEIAEKVCSVYHNLREGGKMVLLLPNEHLYGNIALNSLWNVIINDNSLKEIIQLPPVMGGHLHKDCCVVIAEKGRKDNTITFTDARFAFDKTEDKNFKGRLDLTSFVKMMQNGGIEEETGLRKSIQVPSSSVNPALLIPQVYVVEKPATDDNPVPLSNICQLVTKKVRDVKCDLPLNTPIITASNLSLTFCGSLDVTTLKKANCPNNPPHTEEYSFDKNGNFIDNLDHYIWSDSSEEKSMHVAEYRQSTFLDGSKHAVLFAITKRGLKIAFFESLGTPVAVENHLLLGGKFYVLYPQNGIDAQSLLAILRQPVVYRQLQAYEEFGLYGKNGHLKDIFVPTNKRIIHDEKQQLYREQDVYQTQEEKLTTKKTEYINEVRMRKHDMGQYIFEMANIEDLMRYYLDNRETEKDFSQQMKSLLDNFRSSLGELSTLLADLSKEEQFGEPEIFNIDEFLSNLKNRHKADGFKIEYSRDESSIKSYYLKLHIDDFSILDDYVPEENTDFIGDYVPEENTDFIDDYVPEENTDFIDDYVPEENTDFIDDYVPEENTDFIDDYVPEENTDFIDDYVPEENTDFIDDYVPEENTDFIDDYVPEENTDFIDLSGGETALSKRIDSLPKLFVSPNDIQRLVSNIVDNARKHGFTDHSRKDYEIKVSLSIDIEKNMFKIDFKNNGNPLPEGMNKMRYGIKGEKAGKTAGTGIGGSYVKKFVEHYGGDYDVFMEGDWAVIRIVLPIKK